MPNRLSYAGMTTPSIVGGSSPGGGSTVASSAARDVDSHGGLRWLAAHLAHEQSVCRTAPGVPGVESVVADVAVSTDGTQLASLPLTIRPFSFGMHAPVHESWRWRAATRPSRPLPTALRRSAVGGGQGRQHHGLGHARGHVAAALAWQRMTPSPPWRKAQTASLLASGGEDSAVRLWNAKTGDLVRELRRPYWLRDREWRSRRMARSLVSGGWGTGTLRIWEVATGAEKQALQGPAEGLLDVAVQPAGPWLAGAGRDGAVWVWNADALAFAPAQTQPPRHRGKRGQLSAPTGRCWPAPVRTEPSIYGAR